MLHSYIEGEVVLEVAQLRNPIIAMMVKKYIAKIEGIERVAIKKGVITINYNPEILPTKTLLTVGRAELGKYGIELPIPQEVLDSLA